MARAPNPPPGHEQQPVPPNLRFRWEILLGLLVVVALAWFITHAEPSVTWQEAMAWLNVVNYDRYTRLMVLGCVLVAVTLIVKTLRSR